MIAVARYVAEPRALLQGGGRLGRSQEQNEQTTRETPADTNKSTGLQASHIAPLKCVLMSDPTITSVLYVATLKMRKAKELQMTLTQD